MSKILLLSRIAPHPGKARLHCALRQRAPQPRHFQGKRCPARSRACKPSPARDPCHCAILHGTHYAAKGISDAQRPRFRENLTNSLAVPVSVMSWCRPLLYVMEKSRRAPSSAFDMKIAVN